MSHNIRSFDYQSVADELKIDPKVTEKVIEEVREEFPNDDMLFELHVLRALKEFTRSKPTRGDRVAKDKNIFGYLCD